MADVDETVAHYANRLQRIYDDRTAGDFTFVGVLAEFVRALEADK